MSLVLGGGLDVVGDDDDDDVDGGIVTLGAGRMRRRKVKVPTPKWMRATTSQGVSRPEEELDYLPFDPFELEDGVTQTGRLSTRPQRPFRGERIILVAVTTFGAIPPGSSAADFVVVDPAIYVGAVQVGSTQGAAPLAMFAATAFGVRLSIPPAGQGTDIRVFLRLLPGAGAGTRITVSGSIIGRAMR